MEENPAPLIKSTSGEEQSQINSNTFKIKSNKNNNFLITISKNTNYIILKANNEDNIESNIYISQKDIELLKKNKYFLMFDNINEIYDEIINLMNKNISKIIEDGNKLFLIITVYTTKIKEIMLEINEQEKTDKEKIQELYLISKNLKNDYNNQINELKKIIYNQNNKIKELEYEIKTQNKQIKELKKMIIGKQNTFYSNSKTLTPNLFHDSLIINGNLSYISNLKKWISPDDKPFRTKLLFNKSRNGESFSEFHILCDYQGKTLVLIEGEEGFIIGGYTTKDWNTSGKWYNDEDSFLFSLTKGKIFLKTKLNEYAIRGSKELGPWFAYIGFRDGGKGNLSEGKYYYKSEDEMCFENYNEIIPNNYCSRSFDVKEVEVYKIIK